MFASFEKEVPMTIFSWDGNIDTIMKPIDRKSAYVLKKVNENFKITALIPFTAIAK